MIPGYVSKMSESTMPSAATILVQTDIVNLTGAVGVNTIIPGLGVATPQFLVINSVSGAVVLGTSGNIAVGITTVQNRPLVLCWSKSAQKWLIVT
jgi:hypothetical protein